MEFRQYQHDCADAWYKALLEGKNSVVAVPTGGGKTHIMGLLIQRYLQDNPDDHITVLSHTHSILEQDHASLVRLFPTMDIGVYSAGLDSRTTGQITVGGIQSIANKPNLFKWTNLWIVDEVHGVNHKSEGNYRKILDPSHGLKAGMSATVYRSGHGVIYEGEGALFNDLAYDLTSRANFNKLIDDGYLCNLIPVAPELQLNSKSVKKSAGDYNIKHLAETHDKDSITKTAVKEAIYYGKNYKKWLVFAIDIDHANHVHKALCRNGIKAGLLHSRMNGNRNDILDRFKHGDMRAIVSVGMITTGFDAPNVDMIVLLRPTMSAVLHVQMVGRGLRVAPNKPHCLVLDFAGNTERLGPINDVQIPKKAKTGEITNGGMMTKTCPSCRTLCPPALKVCPTCGHVFQFKTNLVSQAGSSDIISRGPEGSDVKIKWLNVHNVSYIRHKKSGKPDSIKVTYHCGITNVTEYICPEHPGYAGTKGKYWLQYRGLGGPVTTDAALRYADKLKKPKHIQVDFTDKFPNIKNSKFS